MINPSIKAPILVVKNTLKYPGLITLTKITNRIGTANKQYNNNFELPVNDASSNFNFFFSNKDFSFFPFTSISSTGTSCSTIFSIILLSDTTNSLSEKLLLSLSFIKELPAYKALKPTEFNHDKHCYREIAYHRNEIIEATIGKQFFKDIFKQR